MAVRSSAVVAMVLSSVPVEVELESTARPGRGVRAENGQVERVAQALGSTRRTLRH